MAPGRIGQINALLCPAPPFDKPATSASELRAARQGEDAGHKASGHDRYLLTCYRYVELNPVRAGLVHHPGAYPWSSYPHHAVGDPDTRIQDHEVYLALGATVPVRCHAYQALCTEGIEAGALQAIRDHVNKGRVLGSLQFQEEIEAMLKRRVKILPPGRPAKKGKTEHNVL